LNVRSKNSAIAEIVCVQFRHKSES
jgi:hypothetical protein